MTPSRIHAWRYVFESTAKQIKKSDEIIESSNKAITFLAFCIGIILGLMLSIASFGQSAWSSTDWCPVQCGQMIETHDHDITEAQAHRMGYAFAKKYNVQVEGIITREQLTFPTCENQKAAYCFFFGLTDHILSLEIIRRCNDEQPTNITAIENFKNVFGASGMGFNLNEVIRLLADNDFITYSFGYDEKTNLILTNGVSYLEHNRCFPPPACVNDN